MFQDTMAHSDNEEEEVDAPVYESQVSIYSNFSHGMKPGLLSCNTARLLLPARQVITPPPPRDLGNWRKSITPGFLGV